MQRILVWDVPTRVFHWLLVLTFAGAFLTAESERNRDSHVVLGYTLLGLIAFRLLWGFFGTRYARFRSFLFKPGEIAAYVRSLFKGRPAHYVGHNPAGSLAIWLLLGLGISAGVSIPPARRNSSAATIRSPPYCTPMERGAGRPCIRRWSPSVRRKSMPASVPSRCGDSWVR